MFLSYKLLKLISYIIFNLMSLQARSFNGTENKLLTDIKWSALKLHVNNIAPKKLLAKL